MGTVHETGHAMYEQGRNAKFAGLPVSDALSMGAHESQSLFWYVHETSLKLHARHQQPIQSSQF